MTVLANVEQSVTPQNLLHSESVGDLPQISVYYILQHLLPPRDVLVRLAFLEHIRFQLLELRLASFDVRPDAAVPGGIALLHELLQHAILANRRGDLESVGKGI